jgi:EpsI family protein
MLAAGCLLLLSVNRQHTMALLRPLGEIPRTMVGRTGIDRTISEKEQRVAGMDAYLLRYYAMPGDSLADFTTYVGYYERQSQGETIHSPKNCLPGAGWEALEAGERAVDAPGGRVVVNRYLLSNTGERALVYYWYQGRGRVAANEYRVKWDLLRDSALRGRSEEALVRIVVPLNALMPLERADSVASAAAAELIPAVYAVLPEY